jgi:hypothetical protein
MGCSPISLPAFGGVMNRFVTRSVLTLLALACLAGVAAAQAAPQAAAKAKPVDMKKLIAEIIGDYTFEFQGQSLLVQFIEQEGKLFGAPPGETPEEIHPVEGKPLCFDVTVADSGDYYFLEFVRNDQGVIEKCVMTVQGMTIDGFKIKK